MTTDVPSVLDDLLAMSCSELQAVLRTNAHIEESIFDSFLRKLGEVLRFEPNILYLHSPISVCGDIHGQMLDLFKLFEVSGSDFESQQYLFLGDYVDRGYSSLKTFLYLGFLKLKYFDRFFMLRGNHESRQVNQMYGLYNECVQLYGHPGIWYILNEVFDLLPVAAVIDCRIFCVHGGLSPNVKFVEQILPLERKREIDHGTIADLTWSDPDNVSNFSPGPRGIGYLFGAKHSKMFLRNNRLGSSEGPRENPNHGFIARSHQLAPDGYSWLHDDSLVIVWSAPNYSYKSGNQASVMKVDPVAPLEFRIFDKDPVSDVKPVDVRLDYFT
jgi:diadenosine tetraphosphatase ApaH/serine/threonine PP2A family protein phosphatase